MKLNVSWDTLKVFLNLASEYVLRTFSHQPVFLFSRRQERTWRGTGMFLSEISNNRRQPKFKNRFLLATRLLNTNCIWSRLLLPSLIAHARKTSSSFPQFFPHFKPITADYKSVMFTFAIKFEPIRFDVWINCRTQLFGSTQTGIRFGTCKVWRLNCALLSLLKTNDNWIYLGPL